MPSIEINGYSVDEISKALGALAIGAYVLGYVILSYHLSTFGFNPVSPFRPRVLETGVCTLLFFAIPVLIAEAVTSIPSRGMQFATIFSLRALLLPIICHFSIALPGFIDDLPKGSSIRPNLHGTAMSKAFLLGDLIVAVAILVLTLFLIRWMWENYHRKRATCICVLIIVSLFFVRLQFSSTNSLISKRTFLWFWLISSVSLLIIGPTRELAEKKKQRAEIEECQLNIKRSTEIIRWIENETDPLFSGENKFIQPVIDHDLGELLSQARDSKLHFEAHLTNLRSGLSVWSLLGFFTRYTPLMSFSYIMLAIAIYSTWVFPIIPLRVGGGEILPITVYVAKANSPTEAVHGGMLDESDQGFFLLPSGREKGVFIPKERVNAIYFTNGPSSLEEVTK